MFAHPRAQRSKIDVRQQPVRAITAAHPHQHFRRGYAAGSYVLNVGDPLGITAGKTLVTAENCLFVGNGKPGRLKAGNAGLRPCGIGGEA
jgi:hypothetical protein